MYLRVRTCFAIKPVEKPFPWPFIFAPFHQRNAPLSIMSLWVRNVEVIKGISAIVWRCLTNCFLKVGCVAVQISNCSVMYKQTCKFKAVRSFRTRLMIVDDEFQQPRTLIKRLRCLSSRSYGRIIAVLTIHRVRFMSSRAQGRCFSTNKENVCRWAGELKETGNCNFCVTFS